MPIRSLLLVVVAFSAGAAWSAPICTPTQRHTRAELYPSNDPYVEMPVSVLEKKAEAGDARALNALGIYHGTGKRVTKDSKKSFEKYQRAANLGLATAWANLSFMYLKGEGVE